MMRRRVAALAGAALLCVGPALAQDKLPPLRTGFDGTFAPHAMPKLGGGVEGFQIDLFTEVARRMKREIIIDGRSSSTRRARRRASPTTPRRSWSRRSSTS